MSDDAPAVAPLFVSIADAATALGISTNYAYQLADTGELPTRRFGRRRVVPVAALERMAAEAAGDAA